MDGNFMAKLWYEPEGPHTSSLVRSELLEEDINIEDEQMHLESSDKDDN